MKQVSGIGGHRHFSPDEEAVLRRDESTSAIVKRDTKASVEIYGIDRTWAEVKHHQQSPNDNKLAIGLEAATVLRDGLDVAGLMGPVAGGVIKLGASHAAVEGAALLAEILAPVVAFGAGMYELGEAHARGEEQARALAKDTAHVALIGALDLPPSYKAARLEVDYKHVIRGPNGNAFRATEALMQDKKGLATLQLHADRGMNAARDKLRSGMTGEAFFRANPKVADSYAKDAAFREGFDAFLHAKAKLSSAEMKAFEEKLDERDGWYTQSQIQFRL